MIATVDAEQARTLALLERGQPEQRDAEPHRGQGGPRMFRAEFDPLGFTVALSATRAAGRAGHLIARHKGRPGKRMLLIGHLDTVFEPDSPFQRSAR